jgi:hypothetical protein
MEKFVASGAFRLDPGGALDPETDTDHGERCDLAARSSDVLGESRCASNGQEYTNAELFYRDRV